MKYSTKLSDTIHILIFIALGDDEQLSSTKIAESIKTNPAYVRQLMATLKNAGIVVNTQGHANAALAKSADKINMYEIYRAISRCFTWTQIPIRIVESVSTFNSLLGTSIMKFKIW
jgi:DNA-binding IscR family transcriptional regulator